MNLQQWAYLLWQQLAEAGALQWLALALGVVEVLLAKENHIALYPTGMAATGLSIFLLFEAGLYAECLLNVYYIVMSIWGWWYWIKKHHLPPVAISRCSRKEWWIVLSIVLGGFCILSFVLRYFTPSNVPFWDAWVSAAAWAGMWLLVKRKIENWILLNISNAFAIPLLVYKQLPLYAALTAILFIVAVQGYRKWKGMLQQEKGASSLAVS